jgi:hypothetical protein
MRLEWILHPLLTYILLGAGLSLCLYLFSTLKADLRAQEKRRHEGQAAITAAVAAVRTEIEELRDEIRVIQEQTGMLVPPAPTKSGLNLNKRGQVLQMHRRGQAPEQIASSLGLPLTEIELLIKVHQIVLEQLA